MTTAPRTRHRAGPQDVRITMFSGDGEPTELTLSYPLDPDHEQLLHDLHDDGNAKGRLECRMHDDDPTLRDLRSADGRIHEAWLLIREISDPARGKRLILAHWPNTGITGSHAVPSRMTPEHRHRQEYIALRGQSCGYNVELEKRLANGFRPDAVITGAFAMAAEVQLSDITTASVRRRTAKAAEHNITSTWFAGSKDPVWAFKAPHVETNDRYGFDPRSWWVATGPRVLEYDRCQPGSRVPCTTGRNWCGQWHPMWRPILGLSVDDIVEQVPAGDLVRLDTGTKQGVVLTSRKDHDRWTSAHMAAVPEQRNPSEPTSGLRHNQYGATRLRQRIQNDRRPTPAAVTAAMELVEPPLHRPRPCPSCGRESRAIVDGHCLACRAGVA